MKVFTKRNALVGFVTLKALERRRQRRRRSTLKLATFVALGLVSVGILAALAAVVARKQRNSEAESMRFEGYAVSDDAIDEGKAPEIDFDAKAPEPGFAA